MNIYAMAGAVVGYAGIAAKRSSPLISADHWSRSRGNIIGHRGCRTDETPTGNTMSAFKAAAKGSAVGIELDLQITADNKIVVYHDLTTAGNLHGPDETVMKMTYAELSQRKFKKPEDADETIPLFEEVVEFASQNNLKLVVELKGWSRSRDLCTRSIDILKRFNMMQESMIITFNPIHLYNVRSMEKEVPAALLVTNGFVSHFAGKIHSCLTYLTPPLDRVFCWASMEPSLLPSFLGATIVAPNEKLIKSQRWVERVHSYNMSVDTWTVNCQQRAAELRKFGVNFITTDSTKLE
eukprot:TRINITY_DN7599_c1_g2_i1.p1 TRINITY_DN7599_c1_g2~~TRINITY_DN7599_c1_g2_i1.p1  ORF type:complete len:314 (+),score=54.85 TRINITY_DN7599_c1_g2_i1:59-943(+)